MSQTTLDINSCTADELSKFTGISEDIAKNVVEYRNSKGAFYHMSEILESPGLDRNSFIRLTGISGKKADNYYLRYNIKKNRQARQGQRIFIQGRCQTHQQNSDSLRRHALLGGRLADCP
ncbi:helix-hairpin-helix domain-containing protein [Kamptonema cortianum]|nr:helix-hairpin-helix domain-containing protein [Kamptonema cortianum]